MGSAFVLFGLSAACGVLVTLVEVFERTKAVQPAEFAAGELLFAAYPALRVALIALSAANALLLLWGAWRARANGRSEVALFVSAAVAQALVVFGPLWSLLAGLALGALFLLREERALRAAEPAWRAALACWESLRWRAVLARLPGLALCSALGLLLFGAAEAWLSTSRHVGRLFSWEDFRAFLALGLAGCAVASLRWALEIAFLGIAIGSFARAQAAPWSRLLSAAIALGIGPGSRLGVELLLALLVLALFDRWCARDTSGLRRAFAPAVLLALYALLRLQGYLFGALADEIRALGLLPLAYAALAPLAVLAGAWTHAGLSALVRARMPQRALHGAAMIAVAFAAPPLALLVPVLARGARDAGHLLRRAALPAALPLIAATWALGALSYPILNDYSQIALPIWAALLGATAAALFLLLQTALLQLRPCGGRAAWVVLACVAVLAVWSTNALDARQGPRVIAAQHAKILKQMLDGARLLPLPPLAPLAHAAAAPPLLPGIVAAERYPLVPELSFYAERRPPIFFVLWDGARADHMSCHGYARRTTPRAERLAEDAIVFERAYANATATTASVRHLFGGRYASRYMLAQEHAPFFTGALVRHGYDRLWLNVHGSDYNGVSAEAFLRCQPEAERVRDAARFFSEYEEQEKTRRAIALLDEELRSRADRPHPADGLFFYLHCASTHFPWRRWEDHEDYGTSPVDLYDNSMGHADAALGLLMDALRERGLYDDAVIVLTADHGTGLGEHGKFGGFLPYEEQLRVPLVLKLPAFAARRVQAPVASLDVAPTFLSLFEPGAENAYDGWSLLSLAAGLEESLPRRYLFSFCAFEDALAVIDLEREQKLHLHRQHRYYHLYELLRDPGETRSIADRDPAAAQHLLDVATGFLQAGIDTYANPYHYRAYDPR